MRESRCVAVRWTGPDAPSRGLGSGADPPQITTDFSESQVELITRAHGNVQSVLDDLTELHQFTYRVLRDAGDEMLWASSMPCGLPTDETIPLARYGSSNIGRAKSVHRMGLGTATDVVLQTISGIHCNWSLPGLSNTEYFCADPQLPPSRFLLMTLFGASPAVCSTFVEGRPHGLAVAAQWQHVPCRTAHHSGRTASAIKVMPSHRSP